MKHPGRKLLSLLLALVMTLALVSTAFADKSTTTSGSASVDRDARTEMYVVSSTPGSDYVYYGSRAEPNGGVYFGRFAEEGVISGTKRGAVNSAALANESIVAHYLELYDTEGLEHWSYIFGPIIADGSHALLINLNFSGENEDLGPIVNGTYDSKLRKDFQYLNTLSCPVLVRIGGEMNVWSPKAANADEFINAYRHVVDLLRANAPQAAAVFSPNFSSEDKLDMDKYYPGDSYVDWVGCSLYFHYAVPGYQKPIFRGSGPTYGDPMLNVQQCANLSSLHNKPLIITEGGSTLDYEGDHSAFVSERLDKEMSFLPMVYPQIKAIVSSNYADPEYNQTFDFSKNSTANAGYQHGVDHNPTLLHSVNSTPSYYTKVSAYTGPWEGTMKLAAYTWSSEKLTATWYVDGAKMDTPTNYPYNLYLNADSLSSGSHTVTVTFSNGATKSCTINTQGGGQSSASNPQPSTPQPSNPQPSNNTSTLNAQPTDDTLFVDGLVWTPTVYKINDNNYFKIRDVALMLTGTAKQFELRYDASLGAVQVLPGQFYTPNGSEMGPAATSGKNAVITSDTIYINGQKIEGLTVYQIDGSNYFKLRDLGKALDFYVGWDPSQGMIISSTAGYSE